MMNTRIALVVAILAVVDRTQATRRRHAEFVRRLLEPQRRVVGWSTDHTPTNNGRREAGSPGLSRIRPAL